MLHKWDEELSRYHELAKVPAELRDAEWHSIIKNQYKILKKLEKWSDYTRETLPTIRNLINPSCKTKAIKDKSKKRYTTIKIDKISYIISGLKKPISLDTLWKTKRFDLDIEEAWDEWMEIKNMPTIKRKMGILGWDNLDSTVHSTEPFVAALFNGHRIVGGKNGDIEIQTEPSKRIEVKWESPGTGSSPHRKGEENVHKLRSLISIAIWITSNGDVKKAIHGLPSLTIRTINHFINTLPKEFPKDLLEELEMTWDKILTWDTSWYDVDAIAYITGKRNKPKLISIINPIHMQDMLEPLSISSRGCPSFKLK